MHVSSCSAANCEGTVSPAKSERTKLWESGNSGDEESERSEGDCAARAWKRCMMEAKDTLVFCERSLEGVRVKMV